MILYTMMPLEQVFPPNYEENGMELVNWKGIPLMVERAENQYKVIRIMSTDPVHYLDESIAPGQFISM